VLPDVSTVHHRDLIIAGGARHRLRADVARWAPIVRQSGARPD
jgi:hypothetical protein